MKQEKERKERRNKNAEIRNEGFKERKERENLKTASAPDFFYSIIRIQHHKTLNAPGGKNPMTRKNINIF